MVDYPLFHVRFQVVKTLSKCGGFWHGGMSFSSLCFCACCRRFDLQQVKWNPRTGGRYLTPPRIPQKHTSFLGNLLETTWKFTSFDHGISLGNLPEKKKSATADFLSRLPLLLLLAQKLQISCLEEFVGFVTSMVVFHKFFIRDIKARAQKKGVCCYFILITN